MKPEFVLVDFENIQPKDLGPLSGRQVRIRVFVGTDQSKIPLGMAQAMQALGRDAEYVQIEGNGRNALDFHIAYYMGRLAADYPGASFHIVSKDSGFDPLIRHLKAKGISCRRTTELPAVASGEMPGSSTGRAKLALVVSNLEKRKAARPRTLVALRTTIQGLFANRLSDAELDGLIGDLTARGTLKIADGKIQYELAEG